MAFIPAPSRRSDRSLLRPHRFLISWRLARRNIDDLRTTMVTLAAAMLVWAVLAVPLRAQGTAAHVSAVTPTSGKADASITITGQNLSKTTVTAVFLSDAKTDHKAVVVDQEATKIVIKVPELKPGDYNVSVEEGGAIYIQPVIFKVTT